MIGLKSKLDFNKQIDLSYLVCQDYFRDVTDELVDFYRYQKENDRPSLG
jgi:hypothetical protein